MFRIPDTLAPLQIPERYSRRIFRFSLGRQLAIALMLNILSLALPIMMLQVYDRIIPHQSYGTLILLVVGVIVALGFDAALRIIRSYMVGWTAASYEHAANCAGLDRLSNAKLSNFERVSPGEHLQNFNALGRLRDFYSGQAMTALVDLPFVVIFMALIAYLGGALVLVPIVLLGMFILSARFTGERLRHALERRNMVDDRKSSFMVSVLTGIHTIKAIAMEAPMMRRFEAAQSEVSRESYHVASVSVAAGTLSACFGQLSLILTATFGCLLVISGDLSVGGLSACSLLAGRAIQPIQRVLGTWLRLQDVTVSRHQADMLLAIPVQARAETPPIVAGGGITIDDVSFTHTGEAHATLKSISLSVEAGENIAITGTKGSGKSTLLQIIAGLIVPGQGSVSIGAVNPAEYSLSALRPYVGYLAQQGTIFRGTILENLTGFRNDEISILNAREAARELGLDQVVDHLPRGYNTILTDTSADPIPPGVKQRVALARVLANKPSIILFDDADRALDKDGYNMLFRQIGRLKGRRTIVLVTQDQNLMSFSDRVYTLEDGTLKAAKGGFA